MSRSKNKGPFTKEIDISLIKKTNKIKLPRNLKITEKLIGTTVTTHSGKSYEEINVVEEMLGFKIGEFCPTRAKFEFKKKKKKK